MTNDETRSPNRGSSGPASVIRDSFVLRHSVFVINPLFAEAVRQL
jgi:hypothetical protein